MPAVAWWFLAICAMVGMFVACVIAVSAGVRLVELALARRRQKPAE
jgi:hypothetical protein